MPAGARELFTPDAFALRIEADGRSSSEEPAAFGLVCWELNDGYHFLIATDGTWAIVEETVGERTVLAEGAGAQVIEPPGWNRLRADCIGAKRGARDTARLVLTVNGKEVVTVEDREPTRSFKGIVFSWVGVSAFPLSGSAGAEFDNLLARRLRAE